MNFDISLKKKKTLFYSLLPYPAPVPKKYAPFKKKEEKPIN